MVLGDNRGHFLQVTGIWLPSLLVTLGQALSCPNRLPEESSSMVMGLCGNQLPKCALISALSAGEGEMLIGEIEQGGPTLY